MDRANIDTDQIIPKQFLKRVERSGFGQYLFYDWRFLPDGTENSGFILNQPSYRGASILVTGANFGCGSSREHAPWALTDYGVRVIIAPSFADIFYQNAFKNGLLPLVLDEGQVAKLMAQAMAEPQEWTVDVERRVLIDDAGTEIPFALSPYLQETLLNGLDDIARTLAYDEAISRFETKYNK